MLAECQEHCTLRRTVQTDICTSSENVQMCHMSIQIQYVYSCTLCVYMYVNMSNATVCKLICALDITHGFSKNMIHFTGGNQSIYFTTFLTTFKHAAISLDTPV